MTTMRAAVPGDKGLTVQQVARPEPKPNQVLVRVRYCGLNRADLMGAGYSGAGSGPFVGGTDWSGEVVAVGAEVQGGFKPGDKVMCSGMGGYGEYAVTDWGRVLPLPKNVSEQEGATLMVALQTMHQALATAGNMHAGEHVLIQGASSGVGILGMQLAKLMGAKSVIGTATNAARLAKLKDFGGDFAIDSSRAEWAKEALDATGGRGIDVVVDMVSGKLVNQTLAAMAVLGRIVNVGRLGGNVDQFDFGVHALKRISYIGVTFRNRSLDEVREITQRMRADCWGWLEARKLRIPIDRTFGLDELQAAHQCMRANQHFGKILVQL